MHHDGWRQFLPYVIDLYKNNVSTVTQEGVVGWYRPGPGGGCGGSSSYGWTTGNTHSLLQYEYPPQDVIQDRIFFSALLGSSADISVTVGSASLDATFTDTPSGGVGIYHGSVPFTGHNGAVTITVSRSGAQVAFFTGAEITAGCTGENGMENFNAWVGYDMGGSISAKSLDLSDQVCVKGWGYNTFEDLCSHSCEYGYCPIGACPCENMGPQKHKPTPSTLTGYPLAGESADYSGLCSFDCTSGDCNSTYCGTKDVGTVVYTVSPFLPPNCTGGTGEGNLGGLCSFGCNYGFCPINNYSCTSTGALNPPPPTNTSITAYPIDGIYDNDLCKFAVQHGYSPLPTAVCAISTGDSAYCDSEDSSEGCVGTPVCDTTLSFDDLDSLASAVANDDFPPSCADIYILPILRAMLFDVEKNYTDINDNYDTLWSWYLEYVDEGIPSGILDFMSTDESKPGQGNKYFSCVYSDLGKNGSSGPCPVDVSGLLLDPNVGYSICYTLEDKDGFFDALNESLGIPSSWIQFTKYIASGTNAANEIIYYGFPQAVKDIDVPNPKAIFTNASGTEVTLKLEIAGAYMDALLGLYGGNLDDVVQSVSNPVFVWAQALSSMEKAKELGEEGLKDSLKEFAVLVIGGILAFVPFVTGLLPDVEVAEFINSVAWLANGGVAIYETVEDPSLGVIALAAWLVKDFPETKADGTPLTAKERQTLYEETGYIGRTLTIENIAAVGELFKVFKTPEGELTKLCLSDYTPTDSSSKKGRELARRA